MVRRSRDGEWKTPIPKPVIPVPENKKVHQVYCNVEKRVNDWLKENPNIEVVNIEIAAGQSEVVVMVIYKIELEEAE